MRGGFKRTGRPWKPSPRDAPNAWGCPKRGGGLNVADKPATGRNIIGWQATGEEEGRCFCIIDDGLWYIRPPHFPDSEYDFPVYIICNTSSKSLSSLFRISFLSCSRIFFFFSSDF